MKGFRSTTTAAALRALFAFFAIVCDDAIGFVTTATRLPVRLQSTGSWIKSRIFPGTPSARRANGIDRGVRGLTATLPSVSVSEFISSVLGVAHSMCPAVAYLRVVLKVSKVQRFAVVFMWLMLVTFMFKLPLLCSRCSSREH